MATVSAASSTAGTLNAPGVGSGLDVKSLVNQLMAAEQKPLTQLVTKEAKFQAKLSSLGTIKGVLSALQTAASALASASTSQYSATTDDTSMFTAVGSSSASSGNYNVSISTLAQAQKLLTEGKSSTAVAIGNGIDTTVTFTLGTTSGTFAADPARTPVSLVIGSSNNTLAGIRDAINTAGAGVTASIINDGSDSPYRLTITSNATGVTNSLKITTSGESSDIASLLAYTPGATQTMTQSQAARNAALAIDGVAITSTLNTVTDAIQGVTLTLKKVHTNPLTESTGVAVQRDNSGQIAALGALVKGYNDANKTIAAATAKTAIFQGDSGVLAMQSQVRAILSGAQSTGGAYSTLSQLGVAFQKDGSLALDSAKLNAALTADPASVATLTAAIGTAINTAATGLIGASGPVSSKTDSINRSIKDIGTSRIQVQRHLDATQERYQKQFSALDTMIAAMNKTSSFLTQQLDSIANMLKK